MTTFRIGELEVTRVEDFIMPQVPMKSLLPEVSEPAIQSNLHWLGLVSMMPRTRPQPFIFNLG